MTPTTMVRDKEMEGGFLMKVKWIFVSILGKGHVKGQWLPVLDVSFSVHHTFLLSSAMNMSLRLSNGPDSTPCGSFGSAKHSVSIFWLQCRHVVRSCQPQYLSSDWLMIQNQPIRLLL